MKHSHSFFSRGYAKHRNDYLSGDRLCKCVTHSDVNFWLACEQAHLFGRGASTKSWREALPTLFLASPVLGTSEPAGRLTFGRELGESGYEFLVDLQG